MNGEGTDCFRIKLHNLGIVYFHARITEANIAAFATAMQANLLSGDTSFRRAYIRSVIDQVEVDDTEVRIIGRKSILERLVAAGGAGQAAVPSFVRKWRTRQDSNL